jgi:hypothetical protein
MSRFATQTGPSFGASPVHSDVLGTHSRCLQQVAVEYALGLLFGVYKYDKQSRFNGVLREYPNRQFETY